MNAREQTPTVRWCNPRPACWCVCGLIAGLLAGRLVYEMEWPFFWCALGLSIAAIPAVVLLPRRRVSGPVILIVVGYCLFHIAMLPAQTTISASDERVQLAGRICETNDQRDYGDIYILDSLYLTRPDGTSIKLQGKLRLTVYNPPYQQYVYGSTLHFTGRLRPVDPHQDMDFAVRYLSMGLVYMSSCDARSVSIDPPDRIDFYGHLVAIRQAISVQIQTMFGNEADLAEGLLMGQKRDLDSVIYESFQISGAAHLLVVSGLHVSCLAAAVTLLFQKVLHLRGRLAFLLTLALMIVYSMITCFSDSTIRAIIMWTVFQFSVFFGSKRDMLSSIAVSLMLILLVRPLDAFLPGMQLSFGAVMGIACFAIPLQGRLRPFGAAVSSVAAPTIAAQIGLLPVMLAVFGDISIVSLLANLFMIPLSVFATIIAFIALLLGMLFTQFQAVLTFLPVLLLQALKGEALFFASYPWATLPLPALGGFVIIPGWITMFATSSFITKPWRVKWFIVTLSGLLAVACLCMKIWSMNLM